MQISVSSSAGQCGPTVAPVEGRDRVPMRVVHADVPFSLFAFSKGDGLRSGTSAAEDERRGRKRRPAARPAAG